MVKLPPLILASGSPRRAELLRLLDRPFRVVTSDAAELHDEQFTAREVAQLNAYRKARIVAEKFPGALILGADTLVYRGTKLYGKPTSRAHAQRMLTELAGHTHQVVTGVCLLQLGARQEKIFSEITDVQFRKLTAAHLRHYLAQMNPLDKAGAYAIQDGGELIIEEITGSFSNVVGLPVERLRRELARW